MQMRMGRDDDEEQTPEQQQREMLQFMADTATQNARLVETVQRALGPDLTKTIEAAALRAVQCAASREIAQVVDSQHLRQAVSGLARQVEDADQRAAMTFGRLNRLAPSLGLRWFTAGVLLALVSAGVASWGAYHFSYQGTRAAIEDARHGR